MAAEGWIAGATELWIEDTTMGSAAEEVAACEGITPAEFEDGRTSEAWLTSTAGTFGLAVIVTVGLNVTVTVPASQTEDDASTAARELEGAMGALAAELALVDASVAVTVMYSG